MSEVVGIGLAGGQGVRARPLTLKAPGYLRSKGAMSFLGRRLIRWVISILTNEGIKEYYVIAHGKENRYQIKVMLGYGEGYGVDVKYSPVKHDAASTGSADSTLRMLDHWDLRGTAQLIRSFGHDLLPFSRVKVWDANGDAVMSGTIGTDSPQSAR